MGRELEKSGYGELLVDGLLRKKRTPSLGGMGAKARARVLSGAITVAQPAAIKGRDILLVDDVLTSGATSTACVKALKRAGANTVVIACFARVLDEAIARTR
ncbi:ComF family protein [Qipengyuania sphaerica]|uniref:ComF family protein n=1 Tax=Qipengyuania sphaerica TaxID=2867243 RepID=UPI0031ED03AB